MVGTVGLGGTGVGVGGWEGGGGSHKNVIVYSSDLEKYELMNVKETWLYRT